MNPYTRSLEIENAQLKKRLEVVESTLDECKQKLQKATPRSSDWWEDQILWFIGHDFIGSSSCKQDRGPETREVLYEKDKPEQATIRQICQFVDANYPPKNPTDENAVRKVFRRIRNLRERKEIESNEDTDQVPRGSYRITENGKKVWKLINSKNEYNIRQKSSRGLDFEVNLQTKEIIIHTSTRDPSFYERMVKEFRLLSKKERGRPCETVFFKGNKRLSRELSHFVFLMICLYLDVKKGKIDEKTKKILRKIGGSAPYIHTLLRGPTK